MQTSVAGIGLNPNVSSWLSTCPMLLVVLELNPFGLASIPPGELNKTQIVGVQELCIEGDLFVNPFYFYVWV